MLTLQAHTVCRMHHLPGKEKEGGRVVGKEGGREGMGKEEGVTEGNREKSGKNIRKLD